MTAKHMIHALLLAAVATVGQVTGVAAQTTYTVTTLADSGPGSLRAAMTSANGAPGADTVVFSVSGTIVLGSTLPINTDVLTIDGAGQSITISGNNAVRVVDNQSTLTLNGLTIANGFCSAPLCPSGNGGGAQSVDGTLIVTNSTFDGNRTGVHGGGVWGSGNLTIQNSTFSGNRGAAGGAVSWTGGTSLLTVTNSTFVNNASTSGGAGGAFEVYGNATATVTHATIAGNTAGSAGGAIVLPSARLNLANSIVASGGASLNCYLFLGGPPTDLGGNVSDDGTCPFTQNSSVINTDPHLGPLQDNGGLTLTRGLEPDSPAINRGLDVLAQNAGLTTDQRGALRFGGAAVDSGAFEYHLAPTFTPVASLALERGSAGGSLETVGTHAAGGSPVVSGGQIVGGTWTGGAFTNTVLTGALLRATTPAVSCTQPSGTVRFRVIDANGAIGDGNLQVNVVASSTGACVCPAGSVGDGTTCTCAPGFFKPAGATSCQPADPGHFVNEFGQTEQAVCPVGKYQPNSGSESCLDAAPGHYVAVPAAVAQLSCEPGKYQPNAGATSCVQASPGFYVPVPAATAQLACPLGTTSAAGATACTPIAPVFPTTAVLDTFNRANGGVGSQWSIATSTLNFRIANNRLDVQLGGPLVWAPAAFGTSQEAFVTLAGVDSRSPSQGLLLKVQTGSVPNAGAIAVVYDAPAQRVRVSTLRTTLPAWQVYTGIAATFGAGDRLGARALANGKVEVYKNGTRIATVTLSSSDQAFFNGKGGRIGLWTLLAPGALFDDFGGGTVVP